jgi:hypothetical protein
VGVGSWVAVGGSVGVIKDGATALIAGTAVQVPAALGSASENVADGSEEAAAGMQPLKRTGKSHTIRPNHLTHNLEFNIDCRGERLIPAPCLLAGVIQPGFPLPIRRHAAHSRSILPAWPGQPAGPSNRGY